MYKLVLDSNGKQFPSSLIIHRSSTTGCFSLGIPSDIEDKLTTLIPDEWQLIMTDIVEKERKLFETKRQLLAQYRTEFPDIIKTQHPELLI